MSTLLHIPKGNVEDFKTDLNTNSTMIINSVVALCDSILYEYITNIYLLHTKYRIKLSTWQEKFNMSVLKLHDFEKVEKQLTEKYKFFFDEENYKNLDETSRSYIIYYKKKIDAIISTTKANIKIRLHKNKAYLTKI